MDNKKKFNIDGMDRDIIRFLYKNKTPANQRQIARNIGLSPSATRSRLDNLKKQGILIDTESGLRKFTRTINNKKTFVKSPRTVFWDIDLINKK